MDFNLENSLLVKLSGLAGAVVSLRFIPGSWGERLTMAFGGYIFSLTFSSWVSSKVGIPEGGAGFLLGLFGMAILHKAWEFIQAFPIKDIWESLLNRFIRK